jgi:hypothetical protein
VTIQGKKFGLLIEIVELARFAGVCTYISEIHVTEL